MPPKKQKKKTAPKEGFEFSEDAFKEGGWGKEEETKSDEHSVISGSTTTNQTISSKKTDEKQQKF